MLKDTNKTLDWQEKPNSCDFFVNYEDSWNHDSDLPAFGSSFAWELHEDSFSTRVHKGWSHR